MENKEPITDTIEELDPAILLAKPRNDQLIEEVTVLDGDGREWAVSILPFRGWNIRNSIQKAADNHVESCKNGVTLPDGSMLKASLSVMRTATHLAWRVMKRDGTPLMGDPMGAGFGAWCYVSDSDATLWNGLVYELDRLDNPVAEVDEAKNASRLDDVKTDSDEPTTLSDTSDAA